MALRALMSPTLLVEFGFKAFRHPRGAVSSSGALHLGQGALRHHRSRRAERAFHGAGPARWQLIENRLSLFILWLEGDARPNLAFEKRHEGPFIHLKGVGPLVVDCFERELPPFLEKCLWV